MRISEIIGETPYMHDGEYAGKPQSSGDISDSALQRDYTPLMAKDAGGRSIEFFLHKDNLSAIGVTHFDGKTPQGRKSLVFALYFKDTKSLVNVPSDVDPSKLLQVDSVFVPARLRSFGLAASVYVELIKRGFVVVSDNSQFEDGRQLWKKLAKESGNGYSVYVLDDETGYLTGADGKPVKYDATNIDDDKIWSSGIEFHGYHIVLMAK